MKFTIELLFLNLCMNNYPFSFSCLVIHSYSYLSFLFKYTCCDKFVTRRIRWMTDSFAWEKFIIELSVKVNPSENLLNLAKIADLCKDNHPNSSHHDKSRVYEDLCHQSSEALPFLIEFSFDILLFQLASVAYRNIHTSFLYL